MLVKYASRIVNSPFHNNLTVLLVAMFLDLGAGALFRRCTSLLFYICNLVLITLLYPASVATP